MSITTIYHVSVVVPEQLVQALMRCHRTNEFDRAITQAQSGAESAGENSYSDVEEWAEFHTLAEAQRCEAKMLAVISHFERDLRIASSGKE